MLFLVYACFAGCLYRGAIQVSVDVFTAKSRKRERKSATEKPWFLCYEESSMRELILVVVDPRHEYEVAVRRLRCCNWKAGWKIHVCTEYSS